MIYVMSFFENLPGKRNEKVTNSAAPPMASISSDVVSYCSTVKKILTWLKLAEDKCMEKSKIVEFKNLPAIKEEFQSNENFMLELTEFQNKVGGVLQRGNNLLQDSVLSKNELDEVNSLMQVVNKSWEDLRIKAMDRQSFLHQTLMKLQTDELDRIGEWIKRTEVETAKLEVLGTNTETLQQQLDALSELQRQVENEQSNVTELQRMVIVIDDSSIKKGSLDLEKKLLSLSDRWGSLCRFIENRSITVQELIVSMKELNEELAHCERWVIENENYVEKAKTCNKNELVEEIAHAKNVIKEANVINTVLEKISGHEEEMIAKFHCPMQDASMKVADLKHRISNILHNVERLIDTANDQDSKIEDDNKTNGQSAQGIADVIYQINRTTPEVSSLLSSEHKTNNVDELKNFFVDECKKMNAWLEEIEYALNSGKLPQLEPQEQYFALLELIQRFKTNDNGIGEIEKTKESLFKIMQDEKQLHELATLFENTQNKWNDLQETIIKQRNIASFKVDEEYFRKELEHLNINIIDLQKSLESSQQCLNTARENDNLLAKLKTVKAFQDRARYLHKLVDNMEKEHGAPLCRTLRSDVRESERTLEETHHLIRERVIQREKDSAQEESTKTNSSNQSTMYTAIPEKLIDISAEEYRKTGENEIIELHERTEHTIEHEEVHKPSAKTKMSSMTELTNEDNKNGPKMLHSLTNIYNFPDNDGPYVHRHHVKQCSSRQQSAESSGKYNIQSIVEIFEKPEDRQRSTDLRIGMTQQNFFSPVEDTMRSETNIDEEYLYSMYRQNAHRHSSDEFYESRASEVSNLETDKIINLFNDSKEKFVSWLEHIESILLPDKFEISEKAHMERKRNQFNELYEKVLEEEHKLDKLRRLSFEYIPKVSKEEGKATEMELNNLADRLSDIIVFVRDRSQKYSSALRQLNEYENDLASLRSWLKEMELSLHGFERPKGDAVVIQSQINKANNLLKDARTLQPNVDRISETAIEISRYANETFSKKLIDEADEVAKRWSNVVGKIKDSLQSLENTLKRNRSFEDNYHELEMWVTDKHRDVPTDDGPIYYQEQITERIMKFKNIANELERKKSLLNSVLEQSKDLISNSSTSTAHDISSDMISLRNSWSNLEKKVDLKIKHYTSIEHIYNDLRGLLEEENRWLEQLQTRTLSSINAGADAEEISEELDSLERLVKNHPTVNRQRIAELNKTLESKKVMIPALGNQIKQFEFKWDQLHEDALKKIQSLEEAIIESQRIERHILELQDWMSYVDNLLTNRQKENTYADDVPQEAEMLREEFYRHEQTLQGLEDRASFFRISGKTDAARRLDQQIELLKKRFNDVNAKFRQFQKPADFEPKLAKCRRVLQEVEQSIHAIDIKSDDPDVLQMQLDSCMKLYKTLSDIKSEVERVIRIGRNIVERKQIDNLDETTRQLDKLKQSFNDMGAKVTNGKECLENALRSLRRFHKEHRMVVDWLNKAEAELNKIEGHALPRDPKEESDWIRSTKIDIRKLDSNFQILRALQRDIEKEADKPLISLGDKISDVERRTENFSKRLKERANIIEDQQRRLEDVYQRFIDLYQELQSKIDRLDTSIITAERYTEMERFSHIQTEINNLSSEIQNLREIGHDLLSKSDKYGNLVQPDIENITERYEETVKRFHKTEEAVQRRVREKRDGTTTSLLSTKEEFERTREELVDNRRTHRDYERRSERRQVTGRSLSESSEVSGEDLDEDGFRRKFEKCMAYLQMINKFAAKGALPDYAEEVAQLREELSKRHIFSKESIEKVRKETERTIHIIEHIEPERAKRLREKLARLEEQAKRIEARVEKHDASIPVFSSTSSSRVKKFDKGVSGSTLVDASYDSSDFLYSTDVGDDRSVISEPAPRHSRYERWMNKQHIIDSGGDYQLQPLLRVRSLRAIDRASTNYTRPRFHSLERSNMHYSRDLGMRGYPDAYAGSACTSFVKPAQWQLVPVPVFQPCSYVPQPICSYGRPMYRERIVDKHIATRQGAESQEAASSSQAYGSRTVPIHFVDSAGPSSVDHSPNPAMRSYYSERNARSESGFEAYRTASSAY